MKKICISRTDSIGDVVLTLPMVGWLKEFYPNAQVIFLGRTYTQPILEICKGVDQVLNYDHLESKTDKELIQFFKELSITHFIHVFPNKRLASLAKKSGIPNRIGTSHRLFHLTTCNHRINFTRKGSNLHESQLNFNLLKPLGLKEIPSMAEISAFLNIENTKRNEFDEKQFGLDPDKLRIILHPKSQGSAVEWGIPNFISLIELLNEKQIQIIITGTENEAKFFRSELPSQHNLIDLSGKLTLSELVSLIEASDALVAASTGPLHIAGVFNKVAIGLFSSRRPIHPGRWKPIGLKSITLEYDENCTKCSKDQDCPCIVSIEPETVKENLLRLLK